MTDKLPNYTWIKFHIDALQDVAFMSLQDATAGLYLKLYLLAGRADSGGLLGDGRKKFTAKELAWHLRIESGLLAEALRELHEAGFVEGDDEKGYTITRFLEEQGPGDNARREKWRERQQRHREKVGAQEEEKEKEEEGEEESHGYVTVTEPPTPVFSPNPFEESLFLDLRASGAVDEERLRVCLNFWKSLAAGEGWRPDNKQAVLELYAPGGLEERQAREARRNGKGTPSGGGQYVFVPNPAGELVAVEITPSDFGEVYGHGYFQTWDSEAKQFVWKFDDGSEKRLSREEWAAEKLKSGYVPQAARREPSMHNRPLPKGL